MRRNLFPGRQALLAETTPDRLLLTPQEREASAIIKSFRFLWRKLP
ncbi:MAG: hypothetical protein PHX94_02190 [Bacteroidales bacterium]|nr:hypothetical protein [Bacteroidales bacterium]